jgi:hypothetical protein
LLKQASLGLLIKQKSPRFCGETDLMPLAEKERFEPPVPWIQDNGFQDRRIRPLCHFSNLLLSSLAAFAAASTPLLQAKAGPFLRRKDNIFLNPCQIHPAIKKS